MPGTNGIRRRRSFARSIRPGNARWILLGVYAALGVAWVFSNAPFTSPDEAAHYLRAIGLSGGSLIGGASNVPAPGVDPLQRLWTGGSSRSVRVPAGLSPDAYGCEIENVDASAACTLAAPENRAATTEVTTVGTYLPLPYLLPALVVRAGADAAASLDFARLATLAAWLALLAAAIAALWDADVGIPSLVGLVVAVTPMVVFLGASVTDSSDEIMASIALSAAALRVSRGPRPPRWVWWLAGVAGFVLAHSRSLGPLWIACMLALWLVLVGRRDGARVLRSGGRSTYLAGGLIAAGLCLSFGWDAAYQEHTSGTLLPSFSTLLAAQHQLRGVLGDLVGNFGYRNVPLSPVAVAVWGVTAAALVAAGALVGGSRERIALALALVAAVTVPILLYADLLTYTGFGLQGRHILPLVVVAPLLAGEALRRGGGALALRLRTQLFAGAALVAAAVQLVAWWTNSGRYAVGAAGPVWFITRAQWSPPLGWGIWLAVVLGACATLLLLAARAVASPVRPLPATIGADEQ